MDSKLIDLFREKVNNNGADLILHRYRNNNGKNQWSIIVPFVDHFPKNKLYRLMTTKPSDLAA